MFVMPRVPLAGPVARVATEAVGATSPKNGWLGITTSTSAARTAAWTRGESARVTPTVTVSAARQEMSDRWVTVSAFRSQLEGERFDRRDRCSDRAVEIQRGMFEEEGVGFLKSPRCSRTKHVEGQPGHSQIAVVGAV